MLKNRPRFTSVVTIGGRLLRDHYTRRLPMARDEKMRALLNVPEFIMLQAEHGFIVVGFDDEGLPLISARVGSRQPCGRRFKIILCGGTPAMMSGLPSAPRLRGLVKKSGGLVRLTATRKRRRSLPQETDAFIVRSLYRRKMFSTCCRSKIRRTAAMMVAKPLRTGDILETEAHHILCAPVILKWP